MTTEWNQAALEFHGLVQHKVKARFDGGKITSDAGVLLLRKCKSGPDCWQDWPGTFAITGIRG